MSYHIIWHSIASYSIVSHRISYHTIIIFYYFVSYCIILYPILSDHIRSHHIISYHIISYHIISYHIISYHIISYHIISYHIISYHISYIIYHISYIIYHISYIIYHIISFWAVFIKFFNQLFRKGNKLKAECNIRSQWVVTWWLTLVVSQFDYNLIRLLDAIYVCTWTHGLNTTNTLLSDLSGLLLTLTAATMQDYWTNCPLFISVRGEIVGRFHFILKVKKGFE